MGDAYIIRRGGNLTNNDPPKYSFGGSNKQVDEGNGNWKIYLYGSGTFRFLKLNGASRGIDVFVVGGGGGGADGYYSAGGGGGRTNTKLNVTVVEKQDYPITIGGGGSNSGTGGTTSAFGVSASGGGGGDYGEAGARGGSGGSGGGSHQAGGGSNGGSGGGYGGYGQGYTTREFLEDRDGIPMYSGGGAGNDIYYGAPGGGAPCHSSASNNTGGGGGAGLGGDWGYGGSGVVVIRNARS